MSSILQGSLSILKGLRVKGLGKLETNEYFSKAKVESVQFSPSVVSDSVTA